MLVRNLSSGVWQLLQLTLYWAITAALCYLYLFKQSVLTNKIAYCEKAPCTSICFAIGVDGPNHYS